MSRNTLFPYSAADLDRFRQIQRLGYDIALDVEAQLEIGMTERDVVDLLSRAQGEHGVTQVFHEPFAWFGRRTLLGAEWSYDITRARRMAATGVGPETDFFPTDIPLSYGMALILDVAPALEGTTADVGYSCTIGPNVVFDELDAGLALIRPFLLNGVRAGESMATLYRTLDGILERRGWDNCHQHYPDRALAHLVFPLEPEPDRPSPMPGFGTAAAEGLLAANLRALEEGTGYPVWNDSVFADTPATPGLWAVEAHIGRDGVGVKFEEVLVVTDDDAFFLDDHLPHTQRWAAAGYHVEANGQT